MSESDPTGKRPHEPGAKLDAGKAPVFQGVFKYFPRALVAVAGVSQAGSAKYTWGGWKTVDNGVTRYSNAMARHLLEEDISPYDQDTGCLHAAQVAWNALARLELILESIAAGGKPGLPEDKPKCFGKWDTTDNLLCARCISSQLCYEESERGI